MFAPSERERIERKALEQAIRLAERFNVAPQWLVPVISDWPFALTADDEDFLRVQKIDPR